MKIALVNDDGPLSPVLPSLIESYKAAAWCSELDVVLPAEEQSWIALGATRFRPLNRTQTQIGKHTVQLISGTPADCASIAAHHSGTRPDLLVSALNLGINAGLGFFLSSGTVGGAVEGFLTGVKSVAFSAHLPQEIFDRWRHYDPKLSEEFQNNWLRLSRLCVELTERLMNAQAWEYADVYSVNLPWEATSESPRVLTQISRLGLGSLFKREGETFRHKLQGFYDLRQIEEQCDYPHDIRAVEAGRISITPLTFQLTRKLPEKIASVIETANNP